METKILTTFDKFNENELILEKIEVKKLIQKLKSNISKKTIKMVLISLLSIYSSNQVLDLLQSENIPEQTYSEVFSELDNNNDSGNEISLHKQSIFGATDIENLHLSQNGWDFIRDEEKLRLVAYDIDDGMITIGYGHAQKIKNSTYKVGDKISVKKANSLLVADVNVAAKGVRRIFSQWKEKGINRYITQGQYDALISMAFNMGVGGLRSSEVIKYLKSGDYNKAAEEIKTARISNKFSGLAKRRIREFELFNKDSNTIVSNDDDTSSSIPNWKQDVINI